MSLIFVDVEAYGGCPALGKMTEFGMVEFKTRASFHGIIIPSKPSKDNPAVPEPVSDVRESAEAIRRREHTVALGAAAWLNEVSKERPVMVSDNPAFDFMWMADLFLRMLGKNPFGHSARRISDFYAGLCGDFRNTQKWKRFRVTPHDHNPVHDCLGNVEGFQTMIKTLEESLKSGDFRPLKL